jgi:guanine deaminase
MAKKIIKARILHFFDPLDANLAKYEYFAQGGLLISDGIIEKCGPLSSLLPIMSEEISIIDYSDKLIIPGFVDTHLHYPQIDVIASPGKDLLDWLERFTFRSEAKYQNIDWALQSSEFFLEELLRNGTTTALVFGTVHSESAKALFTKAFERNVRLITGKVAMDRNCPDYLQDTPESSFEDALELIDNWHLKGRLQYAITPRFAITSSEAQLEKTAELARLYPDMVIQTHLAENVDEVAWMKELFPKHRSYLDVYDQYGLLRPNAVYAHCIYLDELDIKRLNTTQSSIAFCPSSNLFLGSGLMNLQHYLNEQIQVSLATDIGGGTSFSMLRTMGRAYEVAHLRGDVISAFDLFHLATFAGAKVLGLDQHIGNFMPGKEADFIVLDLKATPLMERRINACQTLEEELFVAIILGDDRNIQATYLMGEKKFERR